MLANLLAPGGKIGQVTVVLGFLLALGGVVCIITMGAGLWTEETGNRIGGTFLGIVMLLGAAGLSMQPQRAVIGAVLAVAGSIAALMFYFWAIIPFVVVPVTLVTVFLRARRFGAYSRGAPLAKGQA